MYQKDVVLCSASRYTKKYFLNPDFQNLPKEVCVLFTEEVGGVILLMFDKGGNLKLMTEAEEDDILYDEIGSELKIRKLQADKRELFEQLESYYKAFF
ncbi:DUF6145 family protein [Eubacterium ruminantium]|uniref:DUF6145 family protein n=1 Tax=Eubacterium ruminantium TaxID=42322 RepID=UPI00247AE231|nr:DUF6145 family protein [Eubacterium ruminantium]